MNTVISSMSNWWGGGEPSAEGTATATATDPATNTDPPITKTADVGEEKKDHEKPTDTPEVAPPQASTDQEGQTEKTSQIPISLPDMQLPDMQNIAKDLDEVSTKAVNTAKEWGSFLFTVGKSATQQMSDQVTKTAKVIKDTVEEKTIIGEFRKEQDKFVTENKEKKKQSEASVAPWVGYNEEEAMKNQILALSADKRNVLRNPPAGVQFTFDFESSYPVAMAMLQEDPVLKELRFELVPKQINEATFWRNYFYRVSLIKQSAQLTSIAQQTGGTGEAASRLASGKGDATAKESTAEDKSSEGVKSDPEPEELPPSSPTDHEFVSDSFQTDGISEEDLKKEMQQLGMSDKEAPKQPQEDIPEWERELQAELQEYEVVDDGNNLDDADLEQELMQQLEAESKQS